MAEKSGLKDSSLPHVLTDRCSCTDFGACRDVAVTVNVVGQSCQVMAGWTLTR